METKTCTKCHDLLPLGKFKLRNTGYRESWCNRCVYHQRREQMRRYRQANREKRLQKYKEWRRSNYATYTLNILRKRSRDKRIPFNLNVSDLNLPEFCPVLGIRLRNQVGKATDHSPSVDRLVPRLGYVKGNVMVISRRANMLKNNATISEMEAVLAYMKNFARA